jgi:TRAP-type mannitol/chloroaromatic compound transport system permease small subunit
VIDLSGRFFFNSPLAGGVELVRTFLVMIVFFGLAYTQLKDEHIRMDLLLSHSSRNVKCALEIFGLLIALFVYAFITYATIPVMIQSVVRGEYETGLIPFPMWPARIFMCIGLFLIVFQLISDLVLKLSSIKDLHVASEETGMEEKWNKF